MIKRLAAILALALMAGGAPALAQRGGDTSTITVVNRTGQAVINLFATPVDQPDWGPDRLGAETIAANGRFSMRLPATPCRWDVRATHEGFAEELRLNLDLCANRIFNLNGPGDVDAPLPRRDGPIVFYRVRNDSDATVQTMILRPSGEPGVGGDDALGAAVLEPEQVFTGRTRRAGPCRYDVTFGFEGGPRTFPGLNLCTIGRFAFDGTDRLKDFGDETRAVGPVAGAAPPAQAAPAARPGPAAAGGVPVTIANGSRTVIQIINIRPEGVRGWGEDRLGTDTLGAGQERTFTVERPGASCRYEVRVVWAGGAEEARPPQDMCTQARVAFTGPPERPGQGQAKGQQRRGPAEISEIAIVNAASQPISGVAISSSRVDDWGDNRIDGQPIPIGGRRALSIERDGQCNFDILVTYANGREDRRMRQNICTLREFTFGRPAGPAVVQGQGPANGQPFTFINDGRSEIMEVFVTPVSDTHWGLDRLGSDTLPRRARLEMRLPLGECRFDLLVVHRGGGRDERRNVDLCGRAEIGIGRTGPGNALVSTGTGFYVSNQGHILTNQHVIDSCSSVAILRDGRRVGVEVVASDETNDLALLIERGATPEPLSFRDDGPAPIRAGERVVLVGFPVRQQLGGYNVTEGLIATMRGPRGDATRFQYTAPTQPGNSGGPVFDESGLVIGVVVAQLDKIGGDRTAQNVNFGIRLDTARAFLKSQGLTPIETQPSAPLRPADLLERRLPSVLAIDCLG